jgi:hypothetical protein
VNVQWTVAQRAIQVYYSYKKFANSNADIHSVLKFKGIKKYGLNRLRVKDLESIAYSVNNLMKPIIEIIKPV